MTKTIELKPGETYTSSVIKYESFFDAIISCANCGERIEGNNWLDHLTCESRTKPIEVKAGETYTSHHRISPVWLNHYRYK